MYVRWSAGVEWALLMSAVTERDNVSSGCKDSLIDFGETGISSFAVRSDGSIVPL